MNKLFTKLLLFFLLLNSFVLQPLAYAKDTDVSTTDEALTLLQWWNNIPIENKIRFLSGVGKGITKGILKKLPLK